MTESRSKIAAALLNASLPSEGVASVLLHVADVSQPVQMVTSPVGPGVNLALKDGWAKAGTLAMSTDDPKLLAKLAKNSSIQVRRLVAANTHTAVETLQDLYVYARSKADIEMLTTLSGRLELSTEYLLNGLLASGELDKCFPMGELVERLCKEPVLARFALKSGRTNLRARMLDSVARRQVEGISFKEALELLPPVEREGAIARISSSVQVVDDELANLVLAFETLPNFPSYLMFRQHIERIDPEPAQRLLERWPAFIERLATSECPEELFDGVVHKAEFGALSTFLMNYHEKLSVEQLSVGIERAAEQARTMKAERYHASPRLLPLELLKTKELPPDTVLVYLRNAPTGETLDWLAGKFPNKPRPGDVASLLDNPGWAFGYSWSYVGGQYTNREFTPQPPMTAIHPIMSSVIRQNPDASWMDELVDGLGHEVVGALVGYSGCPEYLASRMTREIGTDPEVWRQAVDLLSKSTTSVGTTLSSLRKMLGIKRPKPPEPEYPIDPNGQLHLL